MYDVQYMRIEVSILLQKLIIVTSDVVDQPKAQSVKFVGFKRRAGTNLLSF